MEEMKAELDSISATETPFQNERRIPQAPLHPLHIEEYTSDSIEELRSYLNREMEIKITDGRILTGKFWCMDNSKNIILGECMEQTVMTIKTKEHPEGIQRTDERMIGLVIVPGKYIVTCKVKVAPKKT